MRHVLPKFLAPALSLIAAALLLLAPLRHAEAGISDFVGEFTGSADMVEADGSTTPRDLSVSITETRDGFTVSWTTVTYKPDGRTKVSPYSIDFLPTDREGIYSAAMRRNVFGHAVQLDPMRGEPFVWGRIIGDTLTVYSLFVAEDGGYELQQFDRTLTDGGLTLEFTRLRNGILERSVSAFLQRK